MPLNEQEKLGMFAALGLQPDFVSVEELAGLAKEKILEARSRTAGQVVDLAEAAIREGLGLKYWNPVTGESSPVGDVVCLGFLGAALNVIIKSEGPHAMRASEVGLRIKSKLENSRINGMWGMSSGSDPNLASTALVSLAGVMPDKSAVRAMRDSGRPKPDKQSGLKGSSSEIVIDFGPETFREDFPTEVHIDMLLDLPSEAGEKAPIELSFEDSFVNRFARWGGAMFSNPLFPLWIFSQRFNQWIENISAPNAEVIIKKPISDMNHEQSLERMQVKLADRMTFIRAAIYAHRNDDGGFGLFDPVLSNAFAVLALSEAMPGNRDALLGQIKLLGALDLLGGTEHLLHSCQISSTKESLVESITPGAEPGTYQFANYCIKLMPYLDPHHLITLSVACMALHVDASFERSSADGYHAEWFDLHRESEPLSHGAWSIAGYLRRSVGAGSGAGNPFQPMPVQLSLHKSWDWIAEQIGPHLLSDRARQRVDKLLSKTRGDHLSKAPFGFEFRFDDDDSVDLMWQASRNSGNLSYRLKSPDPSDSMSKLHRLWNHDPLTKVPPIAFIDNLWFEFDLDQRGDLPPAFFFGPSTLFLDELTGQDRHYGGVAAVENLIRVVKALGLEKSAIDHVIASGDWIERNIPPDLKIFQSALMLSRSHSPIRLCFSQADLPEDERLESFVRIGFTEEVIRLCSMAKSHDLSPCLCVDVSPDGVSSRIGIEIHYGQRRIHHLVSSYLRELQREFEMIGSKVDSFIGLERFGQIEGYKGCQIINSHLKLILDDGQLQQVKGYIGCFRSAAPSDV